MFEEKQSAKQWNQSCQNGPVSQDVNTNLLSFNFEPKLRRIEEDCDTNLKLQPL